MANDHKNDGSFEDTEFEDLDPIEDDDLGDLSADDSFADDAWEDDEIKEADHAPENDDDIAADNTIAVKEKTFVQKNFALIVGAVVVVFGGVIGMSIMGGDSRPPLTENETADALPSVDAASPEFADAGEMPPMPAPINPETAATPSQEPDGALTPMPMPGQADDTELAALTIEEVPAAPAGKTMPAGEAPFDFAGEQASGPLEEMPSEPQLPAVGEAETKALTPAQKAASLMNSRFRERAGLVSESVSNKSRSQVAEEKETPEKPEELAAAPIQQAPQQQPSQSPQLLALQEQLNAQRAQYEKSNRDLQTALDKKNQEIAALQKSLRTLETDLSVARAEAKSAKVSVPAAATQPEFPPQGTVSGGADDSDAARIAESFSSPAESEPAPADEPQELIPASPPVTAVSWELKGASPGKAVLSSRTSGDTRNVVVGDTVQGLGKITQIARENGRWTVQGTRGRVVR